MSYWLSALISSSEIIAARGITPVRALINEAAAMVPGERYALSLVVQSGTGAVHSLAFGNPESFWEAAVDVSA